MATKPKTHFRTHGTKYGSHVALCSFEHGEGSRFTTERERVTCGICVRLLEQHGEPRGAEEWTPPLPRIITPKAPDERIPEWVRLSREGRKPPRWGSADAALESLLVAQRSRSPVAAVDPTPSVRGSGGTSAPMPAAMRLITETADVERCFGIASQRVAEEAPQWWADPHALRKLYTYKVAGAPMGLGRRSPPLPTYQVAEDIERHVGEPVTAKEVTRLYASMNREMTVELAARDIIPWPREGHPWWKSVAQRHAELVGRCA